MVFKTKLIDAKNYQKHQNLRNAFSAIAFIAFIPLFFMSEELVSIYLSGDRTVRITIIILFSSIVVGLLIAFLTRRYKTIGDLLINIEYFEYSTVENMERFQFSDLEYFEISRGATFHRYEDGLDSRDWTKVFKGDNWLTYRYDGKTVSHEFEIQSNEHNELFEQLINQLRAKYRHFKYRSI